MTRNRDAAKVLVFDATEGTRRDLARRMSEAGFDVVEAASESECLSLADEARPSAIILWVHLSDQGGIRLCRQLKQARSTRNVPVLQIRDFGPQSTRDQHIETGADAYMAAPFADFELAANVKALLRVHAAEASRRETEEDYSLLLGTIVAQAGACIAILRGYELRYTVVNPEYQAIAPGVPMAGRRYREVFPEAAAGGAEERFLNVLKHGGPWFMDAYRAPIPGKPDAIWQGKVIRLPLKHDQQPSALVVIHDITERLRAEEALRQSEERYRGLFDSMTEGFLLIEMIWDEAGKPVSYRYLDANPALEKLTHLRCRDIVGKDVREVLPVIESHWIEAIGRVAKTGEPLRMEQFSEALGRWYDVYVYCPEPGKAALIYTDTTERKAAMEALRQSEERYRRLVETAHEGIWVIDAEGRIVFANQRIAELLGYSGKEIMGRLHTDLMWEEDRQRGGEEVEKLRRGTREVWDQRYRRKDGTEMWTVASCSPLYAAEKFVGVLGMFTDITKRKKAEEKLGRSRDRLGLLSRAMSSLLTSADPQDVIEHLCNEVRTFLDCAVFFNFILDAKTQRLRFNACGGVDASLAREVEHLELSATVCGCVASGGCRAIREHLPKSEDSPSAFVRGLGVRAYACHALFGANGEVLGTLSFGATNRDAFSSEDVELMKVVADHVATAWVRKRAEQALQESTERLALAQRAGHIGVYDWDVASKTVIWTPELDELFGMRQADYQDRYAAWASHVHPEDLAWIEPMFTRWFQSGDDEAEWDYRFFKNGDVRWISARGRVYRDSNGKPVRVVGTNVDITHQKEFQAELERLVAERTAKLNELVTELEHFSYTIVHDMRAPFRSMQGFIEIIEEDLARVEQLPSFRYFSRVKNAAKRLDRLITDSLSYSRAVREDLPVENVNLSDLLTDLVESYPNLHPDKANISISSSLPMIRGNQAALTQCFSNLLGNAVKFSKPGSKPTVRVWAELVPEGEHKEVRYHGPFDAPPSALAAGSQRVPFARIFVEDDGVGIPAAAQQRIFGMFQRVSTDHEGSGIGLAIVRKVVERFGGQVGVQSEEGTGSRFWVDLPIASQ